MIWRFGAAVLAGVLLSLSSPPLNWWPLAVLALAVLYKAIEVSNLKLRAAMGAITFVTMFTINLVWTQQFSFAGWLVLATYQGLLLAVATAVTPKQTLLRGPIFISALFLANWLRTTWPLDGIQIGGFTTGQAGGLLESAATIVGEQGLVAVTALIAVGLVTAVTRHSNAIILGISCTLAAVVVVIAGALFNIAPSGSISVATVQAGGPQATPIERQNPAKVFADHYSTTAKVRDPVDLILWPEDVVEVDDSIDQSQANNVMGNLASTHKTTLVAGVVESHPERRFRNIAVAWGPNGTITDGYEKVHRVPFGEYVPARSLIDRFVNLDQVPSDAFIGRGNPTIDVGSHKAAIAISYEGLFARHVRAGVRDGGEFLVVPTNAASYKSGTVANTQVQALRLRSLETRRWAAQAAPTGISAITDSNGDVVTQSTIGPPAVLQHTLQLSSTVTPYVYWGDLPLLIIATLVLILWLLRWYAAAPVERRLKFRFAMRKQDLVEDHKLQDP